MSISQNQKQNLINQLQKFGLNPTDWKILGNRGQTLIIQSLDHRDFKFIGNIIINDNTMTWGELQLLSI